MGAKRKRAARLEHRLLQLENKAFDKWMESLSEEERSSYWDGVFASFAADGLVSPIFSPFSSLSHEQQVSFLDELHVRAKDRTWEEEAAWITREQWLSRVISNEQQ